MVLLYLGCDPLATRVWVTVEARKSVDPNVVGARSCETYGRGSSDEFSVHKGSCSGEGLAFLLLGSLYGTIRTRLEY